MSQEGEAEQQRNGPIWVLLHGFPQTYVRSLPCIYSMKLTMIETTCKYPHHLPYFSYLLSTRWRHFIKFLPASTRLFVPDLPGYGHSSPLRTPSHDKSTVGRAILASLNAVLSSANPPHRTHDIILVGHDRGARVAHRLAVDAASYANTFTLKAVSLIDIVPTLVQWAAMADPSEAAACWHWPFLANVDVAMDMVAHKGGCGGGVFARKMIERLGGSSPLARANLCSDGAMEVYERAFRQESVLRAACRDYEAGAGVDVERQREDQREGRKIEVPVLVLFSGDGLGRRFDVEGEWKAWVGGELRAVAMGEGVGHHLVEEAAEAAGAAVVAWIDAI